MNKELLETLQTELGDFLSDMRDGKIDLILNTLSEAEQRKLEEKIKQLTMDISDWKILINEHTK